MLHPTPACADAVPWCSCPCVPWRQPRGDSPACAVPRPDCANPLEERQGTPACDIPVPRAACAAPVPVVAARKETAGDAPAGASACAIAEPAEEA